MTSKGAQSTPLFQLVIAGEKSYEHVKNNDYSKAIAKTCSQDFGTTMITTPLMDLIDLSKPTTVENEYKKERSVRKRRGGMSNSDRVRRRGEREVGSSLCPEPECLIQTESIQTESGEEVRETIGQHQCSEPECPIQTESGEEVRETIGQHQCSDPREAAGAVL